MKNKPRYAQFAERLRELMIQRGYGSSNSKTGVSPSALAKATDCFNEMALRYLDGRSIPNLETILKISEWLEVEPGYLMFGDEGFKSPKKNSELINIHQDFLKYTLDKIIPILKEKDDHNDFLNFYITALSELSKMEIKFDYLKQVFDLTLKSSTLSNCDNGKYRKKHSCQTTS